jgi:hypothetical protein
MSDELAERLDRFAAEGGTLVVTGQSSFRDPFHNPRSVPALESLGIEEVLTICDDMRSSYLRFVDKDGFSRFDDTELVYVDGFYVYARYTEAAVRRMQLIPPHNFGPPERCYYDLIVDRPGFVVHPFGTGRAIYIPWLPGALFHRQGHPNTAWFCADLLESFAGVEPLGGGLSPQVEAALLEADDGSYQLLSLVNGSGHFGNSFYAPEPMTDVEVVLGCVREPRSVEGLVAGAPLSHVWEDGRLTVRLPTLELFEAIKITLS